MKTENIGNNAGIIWRALNQNEKEMTLEDLMKATGLSLTETATAIGWLARENKIIFNESNEVTLLTVYRECYY